MKKYEPAFRKTPPWCEYCNRPAMYCAQRIDGAGVDVCSIRKHKDKLTGKRREILREEKPKRRTPRDTCCAGCRRLGADCRPGASCPIDPKTCNAEIAANSRCLVCRAFKEKK